MADEQGGRGFRFPWQGRAATRARRGESSAGSDWRDTLRSRLVVPIASFSAATVDCGVALVVLLGMMLFYHVAPGVGICPYATGGRRHRKRARPVARACMTRTLRRPAC